MSVDVYIRTGLNVQVTPQASPTYYIGDLPVLTSAGQQDVTKEWVDSGYYPRSNPSGFIGRPWPFSKEFVLAYPNGLLAGPYESMIWRANKHCFCTGVHAWMGSGISAVAHVYQNTKNVSLLAITGLKLDNVSGWVSSGLNNVVFNVGDALLCTATNISGSPTSIAIQVDFLED